MAPLMVLITIQTADIRERTVLVYLHFIYGTDAASCPFPHHLITYHSITLSSCLGKSVFAQRPDFGTDELPADEEPEALEEVATQEEGAAK